MVFRLAHRPTRLPDHVRYVGSVDAAELVVDLPVGVWQSLGEPAAITVEVEAGD